MIKNTLAIAVTCGLIWFPFVASSDPVPKAPVLCLQGSPCQQPAPSVPAPAPSPPPATATKPVGSGAIKFQPGWYGLYNRTCVPLMPDGHGCDAAQIVSTINSEICPNPNLVGLKITAAPAFLIGDTPGTYTGTSPERGFATIDKVLAALRACGKYLILQTTYGAFGISDASIFSAFFPAFTYPSSQAGGGTARGGAYGVTVNTQASQLGLTGNVWQSDWRDLAIAAITAYCNRYDSNPSFYGIGMIYWNVSLPLAPNSVSGYSEAQFNDYYRQYLGAARSACPTTNVMGTLDYANPFPAQENAHLETLRTMHGTMANTDVGLGEASWGQQVFTGGTGSPTVVDYRGVVRYIEEVESPDMCGKLGTVAPADLFNVMQNGNANNRPRWPNTIVIAMATECDAAGVGWAAWKTFIASKSGKVMNGRDSTLRTPAEVKTSWCESGMTCQ